MKKIALVYAGANSAASVERAAQLRSEEWDAFSIDAIMFNQPEVCDKVLIMPDMPLWRQADIAKAYGDKVMPGVAEILHIARGEIVTIAAKKPRGRPRKV